MLRGTLADCSPHVVLADRSLATRVGGAGVKVTVGVRVSLQSRRTSAGSLVVGGVAFSVGSTGVVSDTGVKTVSVSTDLGDGTLRV